MHISERHHFFLLKEETRKQPGYILLTLLIVIFCSIATINIVQANDTKLIRSEASILKGVKGIVPNFHNGKIRGFTLIELEKNGFFSESGFRSRDIILHINDIILDGPHNFLFGMREISFKKFIKFKILRSEKLLSITVDDTGQTSKSE